MYLTTFFYFFVWLQWLCIPFSLFNPAVKSMSSEHNDWFGELKVYQLGQYLDYMLLLVLGGVPWQVYFQRVLSSKTAFKAQLLSYVAAFGCIIMAIPPMIIGAVARVTGNIQNIMLIIVKIIYSFILFC